LVDSFLADGFFAVVLTDAFAGDFLADGIFATGFLADLTAAFFSASIFPEAFFTVAFLSAVTESRAFFTAWLEVTAGFFNAGTLTVGFLPRVFFS